MIKKKKPEQDYHSSGAITIDQQRPHQHKVQEKQGENVAAANSDPEIIVDSKPEVIVDSFENTEDDGEIVVKPEKEEKSEEKPPEKKGLESSPRKKMGQENQRLQG